MADRDLHIRITGDNSSFGRAANEVTRQVNEIKDTIRNVPRDAIRSAGSSLMAFFSVDFVRSQVQQVMDYAGAIQDMSDRLKVGTQFLQQADYAAKQTGGSLEQVAMGVRELQRSQVDALSRGKGSEANAFAAIGISLEELRSLDPEDLFRRVARAVQESNADARQLDAVMRLLGRSGSSVLPMLRQGFAGLADEADRLGAVISDDTIRKLDEIGDRISKWKSIGMGQGAGPLADLLELFGGNAERNFTFGFGIYNWLRRLLPSSMRDSGWAAAGNYPRPIGPEPLDTTTAPVESRTKSPGSTPASTDALQRIGLFINGTPAIDLQRRQLSELLQIKGWSRAAAENILKI